MKYKLIFESGDFNRLYRDPKDSSVAILKINTEKIKEPWELGELLGKKLSKIKEFELDIESWKALKFENIDEEIKDLILYSLCSVATYIPFSMKKDVEKDLPKWEVKSPENQNVKNIVDAYEKVKKLQTTPPNMMMPEDFVKEAREFFKDVEGVTIKEIKGEELEKEKLNLIMAVGRASVYPPRLLILEYKPVADAPFKALVGKGVCYDSGGLNIKTGPYMSTMKFDMSGGAVSLGVMYSLAKNKSQQNLVVAIPLVENSVAGNSYRPDDVIVSRSGKTVEIDNTDAEGRLVLADAMSYAVDVYKPEEVITIATLTGAIGYALGYKYGGAWATSCDQWRNLKDASKKSFEWIWRMPFDESYLKALKKTKVADIKNSARTGAGGASRAACFLKEFTNDLPYIHLDIANIAHCEGSDEARAPLMRTLYYYLKK